MLRTKRNHGHLGAGGNHTLPCPAIPCDVFVCVPGGPCEEVEIVTRAEWNARPPTEVEYIDTAVNMSFVHHTAGTWECFDKDTCILMVQDIQNLHMDNNSTHTYLTMLRTPFSTQLHCAAHIVPLHFKKVVFSMRLCGLFRCFSPKLKLLNFRI